MRNNNNIVIECSNLDFLYESYEKSAGLLGSIRDFSKRQHRQVRAIKNLDLLVERGEIIGLLGPNGAGKTTLIKLLTGILEPKSGEINCLNSLPFKKEKEYLKSIGVVIGQKSQLIWDLPAIETIRMLKEIYEIPNEEFNYRLDYLINLMNLKEKTSTPVRKLSLGERIKFEIICALVHEPSLLFLDEPTIGLDITSQYAIYNFLQEINRTLHTTIILTSHYMKDIEHLCERVVIVIDGEKKVDMPIPELKQMFKTEKSYIIETKNGEDPFEDLDLKISRVSNNRFIINTDSDDLGMRELNLSNITSIKENIPELEEIIFEMYEKGDGQYA